MGVLLACFHLENEFLKSGLSVVYHLQQRFLACGGSGSNNNIAYLRVLNEHFLQKGIMDPIERKTSTDDFFLAS